MAAFKNRQLPGKVAAFFMPRNTAIWVNNSGSCLGEAKDSQ
jgi:hypothetical protein